MKGKQTFLENISCCLKMVEVTASFDYVAEQPDELSIKAGDVIKNVVISEGGWWEGELNGKKGMFPDNFVKLINKDDKDSKKEDGRDDESTATNIQATQLHSVRDLATILKNQVHEGPPSIRKKAVKEQGNKKKRCKVMYSYDPENDNELKLAVGEILEIVKQEDEGWWEGILNGKQGMFPSNFVDIIEEGTKSSDSVEKTSENTNENLIKGKMMQGVGLENIFGDGPFKLKSTVSKKPDDKPSESPKAEKREDRKQKETKPIERAIVRFSYTAENEDELNLNEGETITILEKELEDSGWWKGDLNGKVGIFPDNFVELIKEEPKLKKPPPPTQPLTKAAPKLPEKAPVTEPIKLEPVKEEKPALTQPVQVAVPNKKPGYPPPPLTKKQTKTADEKEEPRAFPLDVVEPLANKLSHPTAALAKQPNKKPPSQTFTQNEEKNDIVIDLPWLKEEKPGIRESLPSHKPDEVQTKLTARSSDTPARLPDTLARPPDIPARPSDTPAATASLQSAIDDLHKELKEIKDNLVTKTAFNELKSKTDCLKQELENVKLSNSKQIISILSELDDGKKIRLSTGVEMDRIWKMVAE